MPFQDPSIIIIGAGIAGLAAGVYARLNGYPCQIFEMNSLPGGMVTSWTRKGYLIDGCIEFLNGTNPSSRWHALWEELGAAGETGGRKFIERDEFLRVRDPDGKELVFYADIDRLEQHLLELSPQDTKTIHELTRAIRSLADFDPPLDPDSLGASLGLGRLAGWRGAFDRYNKVTVEAFAARFKDPFLQRAFPALTPPGVPLGAALADLAFLSNHNMGYPLGGSLALSNDIAHRFVDLGGEIHYNQRVTKILTGTSPRGGRAAGVETEDGREYRAGRVISAGDGYNAIYNLLDGRFLNAEVRGRYEHLPITPASIQVSLGVARDFSGEPPTQVDLLKQPLYFAGLSHPTISFHHFSDDPAVAEPGKTVVLSRMRSDYEFWKTLSAQPTRYESEKLNVADVLIQHLETRYPGISSQVEMIDVVTPLTYERYTGAFQGIYHSFAMTPETAVYAAHGMSMELPGLDGFFQIGQWIQPGGGVFPAARSGREVIKKICAQDGKRFSTRA